MLFILDTILVLNIWIAIRYFKSLISPPVLTGGGMLAAAIVATLYYDDWHLEYFNELSVFILGGGTLVFTLYCIILSKIFPQIHIKSATDFDLSFIRLSRVKKFYYIIIVLGILGLLLNIYYMRSQYGMLSISELIFSKRLDQRAGDNAFMLPSYIRQLGSLTIILSYFTAWLLSLGSFSKDKKYYKKIKLLLFVHLIIGILNAILSGAKGAVYSIIAQNATFFFIAYYSKKGNYNINLKLFCRVTLLILLLLFSFKNLNLIIGRDYSAERASTDLLAEYCGAQIKNFDIYITDNPKVGHGNVWGEHTFKVLHSEINPHHVVKIGKFQFIRNHNLGNVYTQYYAFYEDFGLLGVFVMTFIVALISMFFYNQSLMSLINPQRINIYLFIYSSMTICLFMSFFSSWFTESVFSLGGIKTFIYLIIFVWFAKKFLFVKVNR